MKRIFKYIAVALATSLLALGCYPEVLTPDQSKLPEASALDVVIDVDQTTNYVTFTVTNEGVVPMWIFGGEDKVDDGKVSKKYAYTVNGLKLRVRDAGTHQVEVKAYNANGVSVGSKIVEYTLENTYIDPFDPAPYIKNFAGSEKTTWEWRYSVDGHFGCGDSPANPTGWWNCKKEEKKDWGLYDDLLTFSADGKYTYNPGEDGMVYVNWESGFKPENYKGDKADYMAPIDEFTTTYTFERSWNDAGIEEVYLVLPAGTNLSYIPSQYALDNPRYLVVSSTAKLMSLVHTNPGVISWKYEFVPVGGNDVKGPTINSNAFPADLTVKKGDILTIAGLDEDAVASMWVDPDYFYHDGAALRFKAIDGDYRFDYDASANWIKVVPLVKGELATYDSGKALWIIGDNAGKPSDKKLIGWTPENALPMARISENTYQITLAVKTTGGSFKIFGQAAWGREFTHENHTTTDLGLFHITNGTDGGDPGNIYANKDVADGFYTLTVVDEDGTLTARVEAYPVTLDPDASNNVWKNAAMDISYWFANNDWGQIANPSYTAGEGSHTIVIPAGTGASQWQGQMTFNNTGLSTTVGKTYDFGLVMNSTEDHPGVTVKLTKQSDDNVFYVAGRHALKAGEDYVYSVTNMPGVDIDVVKLVLDFGGAVEGSTVVIKDIVLIEK